MAMDVIPCLWNPPSDVEGGVDVGIDLANDAEYVDGAARVSDDHGDGSDHSGIVEPHL
jgi:hypothetical protein